VWAETPTKSGVGHSLHTGAKGESGSDQGFVRCEVILLPRLAKMPGGRVLRAQCGACDDRPTGLARGGTRCS